MVVAASDAPPLQKLQADYVCDGVTDQVEIQAAITAATAKGGTVALSEGTFKVVSAITCVQGVAIKGQGKYATILDGTGNAGYVINASGAGATPIQDFHLEGLHIRKCTNGILVKDCWRPSLLRIRIGDNADPAIGIGLTLSSGAVIGISGLVAIDVTCWNTTTALLLTGDGGGGFHSTNSFLKCNFQGVTGISIPGVAGLTITTTLFRECQIEACTTGANIGATATVNTIVFKNCYFDSNTADLVVGAFADGVTVEGGLIHANLITSSSPLNRRTSKPYLTVVATGRQQSGDFYCDGTADQVQINAAFVWLNTAYGRGKVVLTGGTFTVSAAIAPTVNIELEGQGEETIITAVGGYATDIISSAANDVKIRSLVVIGLATSQESIGLSGLRAVVEGVRVTGGRSGIDISGAGSKVINSRAHNTGQNGIYLTGNYCQAFDNECDSNAENGISTFADYCIIMGDYCHNNTMNGVSLNGPDTYNIIIGNTLQANDRGFRTYDAGATNNIITDNIFVGNVAGAVVDIGKYNIYKNNTGYLAPGETRSYSGSLTAGVANAISFAFHNPEAFDAFSAKVETEITTAGGTALSVLQVGIADDAAGTGLGAEFFTAIDLNAVAVRDSYLAGDTGAQTKWVFLDDSGSITNGWIVGKILTQNALNLVGKYYVTIVGR